MWIKMLIIVLSTVIYRSCLRKTNQNTSHFPFQFLPTDPSKCSTLSMLMFSPSLSLSFSQETQSNYHSRLPGLLFLLFHNWKSWLDWNKPLIYSQRLGGEKKKRIPAAVPAVSPPLKDNNQLNIATSDSFDQRKWQRCCKRVLKTLRWKPSWDQWFYCNRNCLLVYSCALFLSPCTVRTTAS